MAEIKAAPVFEGGHWYTRDGSPAYTQPKSDGSGERPTTLRDAKKLKLLPSVTTVLGVLDKPQLTLWKVKNAIRAAAEVARADGEELEAWVERVTAKAGEPVAEAADLGTRIHEAIELACKGAEWDSESLGVFVAPVLGWLVGKLGGGGRIIAQEEVIVLPKWGYAGRVDLAVEDGGGILWVVDWKSRKTRAGESDTAAFAPYPTQKMQLAAYAAKWAILEERGWDKVRCVNVITSSTEPGRFGVAVHDGAEYAWGAWMDTLSVWRWSKGYDPRCGE